MAVATDIRKGLIYNWLTVPAIFAGLLLAVWQSGWAGLGLSLLGMLIGGGGLFLPFYWRMMGGGDVKLMAAVGALMGPCFVGETLLASILVGGVMGFGLMIVRGKLKPTLVWYAGCLKAFWCSAFYKGLSLILPRSPEVGTAPFGINIFIGALCAEFFDVLAWVRFGW